MPSDRDELCFEKERLERIKHKGACVLDKLRSQRTKTEQSQDAVDRYKERSLDSLLDSLIDELDSLNKK